MPFLRVLFWIVVTVAVVAFAANNQTPVTVNLWSDLRLDTWLPVLVIGAFLLGLLPTLGAYYALRWRYRRRIALLEGRERPVEMMPRVEDPGVRAVTPPAAVPTAVPPGVA